ncbi:MAG: hypothetical protein N2645_17920 [Clostridia bacterium]|nr:hypothetical protein [Clostridia bacterium]
MLHNKTKKFISIALSALLLTSSSMYAWANPENVKSKESKAPVHVTGSLPPSKEDVEWLKKNAVKAEKIMPNQLGLERLNKELKKRGQKDLSQDIAVPLGEEVVAYSNYEGTQQTLTQRSAPVQSQTYPLPSEVDNSELACFPPITDQAELGSCAAFSTTYYQMTYMTAFSKGWDTKNDPNNLKKFSPKWTYNMNNRGLDGGSNPIANYRIMKEHGAATWANFPYSGLKADPKNYLEWSTDPNTWRNAANYKIDKIGYVNFGDDVNTTPITSESDEDLYNIKNLLNNGYVLVMGSNPNFWDNTTIGNDPFILEDDPYVGQQICVQSYESGGHSMTLVGYNDTIWTDINKNSLIDPGEKGAFKIANSWGTNDGNNGFRWMAYDALNKVSSVQGSYNPIQRKFGWSGNSAYWITVKNAYTPKLMAQFKLNHGKRNQIEVSLGYSETNKTSPEKIKKFYTLLTDAGGEYAFDGTLTPIDGTFALDYAELIENSENILNSPKRWYISLKDNSADGTPLSIKDFKLIDINGTVLASSTSSFPITRDGSEATLYIDYTLNGSAAVTPAWKLKSGISNSVRGVGLISANGKLYAMGGETEAHEMVNTVEEYNPSTDTWTPKLSMTTTRSHFGIAEVGGKIYVMGGRINDWTKTNIVEEYDPGSNQWTQKADLPVAKENFNVVVLNGKIYALGDYNSTTVHEYDPATDTWNAKADMLTKRDFAGAAVVNGKIYVTGGLTWANSTIQYLKSTEEYNPATNTWTLKTDMLHTRHGHSLVEYNGMLYAIGGDEAENTEVYDPVSNQWQQAEIPEFERTGFGCTKLNNKIYIAGGAIDWCSGTSFHSVNTLLEYVPMGIWTAKPNMPAPMPYIASAECNNKVYVTGGYDPSTFAATKIVQAYDPQSNTWAWRAGMTIARKSHGSASLNGKVYVIGGFNGSFLGSVEEYNPATNSWVTKADMPTARHSLGVAAANGKLYAIGGMKSDGNVSVDVQEYNPSNNTWTTKANMPTPRVKFAIAVLNGKIYIIGGSTDGNPSGRTNLVQEYNPVTDTWTTKANMPSARESLSSAALNGKIYVLGGIMSYTGETSKVEEFDPVSNTWTLKTNMLNEREGLTVSAANQRIYALGGWDALTLAPVTEEFAP